MKLVEPVAQLDAGADGTRHHMGRRGRRRRREPVLRRRREGRRARHRHRRDTEASPASGRPARLHRRGRRRPEARHALRRPIVGATSTATATATLPGPGVLVAKVFGSEGGSTDALMRAMSGPSSPAFTSCRCPSGWTSPGSSPAGPPRVPVEPATSRALEGYRDTSASSAGWPSPPRGGPLRRLGGRRSRPAGTRAGGTRRGALHDRRVAPGRVGGLRRRRRARAHAPGGVLQIAEFSNAGATVAAPGVGIRSARAGGGGM